MISSIYYTENKENEEPQITQNGPKPILPWCRNDQLTFIAEQVSHHPPSELRKYMILLKNVK